MTEPAKDAKPPPAPAAAPAKDAKAGPSAPTRPAHRARRVVRLPAVVFGLLLLAIVLAAAWITWPLWNADLPGWVRTALAPAMEAGRGPGAAAQIAPLADRLAAVESEVKAIRGELAKRPSAADAEAAQRLAQRMDATDKAVAGVHNDVARIGAIESRLAAVEASQKALAGRPEGAAPTAGVDPAALTRLNEEMGKAFAALRAENRALAERLAQATDRLAAVETRAGAAGEASRESAFLLAVGQLREAVRGGRPYAEALAALRAIAGEDKEAATALAALDRHAASGVPSVATLRARFAAAAPRIAAASPRAPGNWFERAIDRLGGLITVRRTGPDAAGGAGPEAAEARAELALAAGDVAGAVTALEGLDGDAAKAAAPWLAGARARIAVDGAAASLDALAVSRLGGGKPQGAPGG